MIWTPSPNIGERTLPISMLVLHYTGMKSGASAIDWLANPQSKVSAHYVVDEDGQIVHMVREEQRAQHEAAGGEGKDTPPKPVPHRCFSFHAEPFTRPKLA